MQRFRFKKRLICALAALPLLAGCDMVVFRPAGDIAQQQGNLILISTGLMLLIILPVMALTILFAWRYRSANKEARYEPDWDHSTQLELVIWAAPLLIIITLGALTWVGTHLLDPYRPLSRTAPGKAVAADVQPLDIQVVALDWKWLFIYPEQGVASVNELALPVDRPVRFRISASSVMNSFYIPALAGQIYAMPGMETKLHAVLNNPGRYEGFSANYSGAGFSNMRFAVKGLDAGGFDAWLAAARKTGKPLDRAAYLALERPSEKEPARQFAAIEQGLFDAIVNMCVETGKMCMHDMMSIDAKGGLGIAGIHNVRKLTYDKHGARGTGPTQDAAQEPEAMPDHGKTHGHETSARRDKMVVAALCSPRVLRPDAGPSAPMASLAPLTGAGLTRPGTHRADLLLAAVADRAPSSPAL